MDDKGLNVNVKSNATIWSIFNADSESLLTSIAGHKFIQPVDEKEEIDFENQNKLVDTTKASFVQLPSKGIPDNPTDIKVTGMTEEELKKQAQNSSGYTFTTSIFD